MFEFFYFLFYFGGGREKGRNVCIQIAASPVSASFSNLPSSCRFTSSSRSSGSTVLFNETGGHLLRTKSHESNEGGVAAGFAVIDSPLLV